MRGFIEVDTLPLSLASICSMPAIEELESSNARDISFSPHWLFILTSAVANVTTIIPKHG